MREFLKKVGVIQEKFNKNRIPSFGRGYSTANRVNPYNPLSYLVIAIGFLIALIMFGVVGIWKEIDTQNPFKWR